MIPRAAWGQSMKPASNILKNIILCTFFLCMSTGVLSTPAQAKYASLVIDADTGEILHATNEETRNYPASLTKMMTLYMIFDGLERKRWVSVHKT